MVFCHCYGFWSLFGFQPVPFQENTAGELQDRASKTQDTLVDAVENAEVAEIKRAVFRALTRLRAATIKEKMNPTGNERPRLK